jgi:potassium-transporting ATPase potassium-binding subunit
MTFNGWLQILLFFVVILALTKPLGIFMARVFNRERTFLDPVLRPIERLIYRLTRVDENREMRWTEYAIAMLLFSAVSMLVLYLLQRLQGVLPFNPQQLPGVDSAGFTASSFNTAASFTTNTNWQSYVPETTMSYLTQMAGLAYHNFVSAAVGIALAIAFIRGIARRQMKTIGNFWVDMTRAALWVCLPFCFVGALLLVADGVPQNLRPYDKAQLVDKGLAVTEQVIAQGPVASQEFIKSGAPMAAVSSTPIVLTRLRTRRRLPTSSR